MCSVHMDNDVASMSNRTARFRWNIVFFFSNGLSLGIFIGQDEESTLFINIGIRLRTDAKSER